MKFLSIDIETTGLDPQKNQILEFGAVAIDTSCGNAPYVDNLKEITWQTNTLKIASTT